MSKTRKSNTTTWIIVIGAALALGYWWLKNQLQYIQIGSASIPFQKLDGTNIQLGIKLPITNASALAANVTGFAGVLLTPSGSVLSTVFMTRPVVVNRYQNAELDFTSTIRGSDLAVELFNILKTGKKPDFKGYRIKGQLRIYGIPLPIDEPLL